MKAYDAVMDVTPRDLPDELELPLRSGRPWWYFVGGRPSVDFVNTLRERWRRRVETLVSPGDLAAWLARAGLTSEPAAPVCDSSPAGRRQWCAMRACGNVAKARRFRARHPHPQTQESP